MKKKLSIVFLILGIIVAIPALPFLLISALLNDEDDVIKPPFWW